LSPRHVREEQCGDEYQKGFNSFSHNGYRFIVIFSLLLLSVALKCNIAAKLRIKIETAKHFARKLSEVFGTEVFGGAKRA
jgi:hypothetical protein